MLLKISDCKNLATIYADIAGSLQSHRRQQIYVEIMGSQQKQGSYWLMLIRRDSAYNYQMKGRWRFAER